MRRKTKRAEGVSGARADRQAEALAATTYVPRKSSRNGATMFSIAVLVAACAVVLGIAYAALGRIGPGAIAVMVLVALVAVSSIHIALSWEKVVVLRLGKVARVVGPGLYFTIFPLSNTARSASTSARSPRPSTPKRRLRPTSCP